MTRQTCPGSPCFWRLTNEKAFLLDHKTGQKAGHASTITAKKSNLCTDSSSYDDFSRAARVCCTFSLARHCSITLTSIGIVMNRCNRPFSRQRNKWKQLCVSIMIVHDHHFTLLLQKSSLLQSIARGIGNPFEPCRSQMNATVPSWNHDHDIGHIGQFE